MKFKLLISSFVLLLWQFNTGLCANLLSCSFRDFDISGNGQSLQYSCILAKAFPFTEPVNFEIDGDHEDSKSDNDVTAFASDGGNILSIPDLSQKFVNLNSISIKNCKLKYLTKSMVQVYKDVLIYLAIKNTQIEVIQSGTFEGFSQIKTIDLQENNIFYVDLTAFDGTPVDANVLLQGNLCKNIDQDIEGCKGPACVDVIKLTSCGTQSIDSIIDHYQKSEKECEKTISFTQEECKLQLDIIVDEFMKDGLKVTKFQEVIKSYANNYASFEEFLWKINENFTKFSQVSELLDQEDVSDLEIIEKLTKNKVIIDAVFPKISDLYLIIEQIVAILEKNNISIDLIPKIKEYLEKIDQIFIKFSQNQTLTEEIFSIMIDENVPLEQIYNKLTKNCSGHHEEMEELRQNYTIVEEFYENCSISYDKLKLAHINDQETIKQKEDQIDSLNKINEDLQWEAEKCREVNGTCRFIQHQEYGYSCIARNISVDDSKLEVNWYGEHMSENLTNADVKALIMRELNIEVIPNDIGKYLTELEILIINNCSLTKLEKQNFAGLENLKDIQITSNKIISIESGTFDGSTNLVNIVLSDNNIDHLPSKIFALLKNLLTLDISKNHLTTLRSDFIPTTTGIKFFTAANNQLAVVDTVFVYRLRNADVIDFNGNRCNEKYVKGNEAFIEFYTRILKSC